MLVQVDHLIKDDQGGKFYTTFVFCFVLGWLIIVVVSNMLASTAMELNF